MDSINSRRMFLKLAAAGMVFPSELLGGTRIESIQTRLIPSSKESLPVVGVGTWQTFDVGNNSSARSTLKEVLKILVSYGGTAIDSSPMYGSSERVVGDLASELGISSKLFCATKVWTSGKQSGISQMERSMNLMKKRPMDLMQIHNLQDWQTHIRTLKDWKEQGKVRHIGITHYIESAYSRMEKIMRTEPIDFIQLNYSITSRTAERSILPLAKDLGIAVIINRPYEGGSLFRKVGGREIPEWAKEIGIKSWGNFFLKFILSNPTVNCVIPGTDRTDHMKDNMQAGIGRMPSEKERKRMVSYIES